MSAAGGIISSHQITKCKSLGESLQSFFICLQCRNSPQNVRRKCLSESDKVPLCTSWLVFNLCRDLACLQHKDDLSKPLITQTTNKFFWFMVVWFGFVARASYTYNICKGSQLSDNLNVPGLKTSKTHKTDLRHFCPVSFIPVPCPFEGLI